jgi:hypothetical protein
MGEAAEAKLQLFEVSMEAFEELSAWTEFVMAMSIGDAVEIATERHSYRLLAPIMVRHLPTISRDDD